MAKNYLTKEEKRNFIRWNKEYKNNTLLTSEDLANLCAKNNNDPNKIGECILGLISKPVTTECDFDIDEDDILYMG